MLRNLLYVFAGPALCMSAPAAVVAQDKAQISGMQNLDFGTVSNLGVDVTRSVNLCVYSSSVGYRVTAFGSASGGAFLMSGAGNVLPFSVEWSESSNSTSGEALSAYDPLISQMSSATHKTCNRGPLYSASLIVRLRAADLSVATAGSYSGSLSVVISPE